MSIRTPVSTTIAQPSRDRPTISSHQPSTPATSTDASPGQTGGITTTFYTFHPMSPAIEESSIIASARRLVVKVGSSLVTNEGRGVDTAAVESWAGQIASLHRQGRQMVLVSSGAIADRKSTRLNSSH